MTNEEARLTLMLEYCPQRCDGSKPCRNEDCELYHAIKALEKQIPKKVKYLNRHGDGPDVWNEDYYTCPSCGRRLRNKQHDNHCGRCGQALDWSVSE